MTQTIAGLRAGWVGSSRSSSPSGGWSATSSVVRRCLRRCRHRPAGSDASSARFGSPARENLRTVGVCSIRRLSQRFSTLVRPVGTGQHPERGRLAESSPDVVRLVARMARGAGLRRKQQDTAEHGAHAAMCAQPAVGGYGGDRQPAGASHGIEPCPGGQAAQGLPARSRQVRRRRAHRHRLADRGRPSRPRMSGATRSAGRRRSRPSDR